MDMEEQNIPLLPEEPTFSLPDYDPAPTPAPPPPSRREEGVWGAVCMQAILAVLLAIGFLGCRLLAPEIASSAVTVVQDTAAHDFSFREQLTELMSNAVAALNQLTPAGGDPVESEPIESEPADPAGQALLFDELAPDLSGQGGSFQPTDEWVVPENATFAPVVFTGALTFPLQDGWRQTSAFGFRDSPLYGEPEFHTAADIAAARGSNILAVFGGTVVESRTDRWLGNYIRIDHGNGFYSTYGHCDRLIAREGARIRAGEVIAKVGSTGDSTGYHLHLALEKDGIFFDPAWVYPAQLRSLWDEPAA